MTTPGSVSDRRAIEALRAGVPNGDAVRALGSNQTDIISAFDEKLGHAAEMEAAASTGFVISGGFGTGKSHLVEELHQRALAANYVSSKVSISKETPLHVPAKVVQAAARTMQAKDVSDGLLMDIAMRLGTDRPAFHDFTGWCGSRRSKISITFRSLLELRASSGADLSIIDLLFRYWSGETVQISEIKRQLAAAGLTSCPVEAVRAAQRPWQTARFLSHLCQVHGFRGWVVFLDEAELVSKYGLISRARAYAQLGRWLGLRPEHRIAGTAVVATVINDFGPTVLDGRGDRWSVPELLKEGRRAEDFEDVPFAVRGMESIDNALRVHEISREHLKSAHNVLRVAHSNAYHWDAPDLEIDFRRHQPMRLYVRRWINEWDLTRLYGSQSLEFSGEEIVVDYGEDGDGWDQG
ncbi:BREX system ATP-binding domain-containing protein [Mycolicibacterium psychrotolerans]|uniref:BREX system ATP-binding domain-containing protein n=1 Tax=Mycolicibacterium psychrotolerans TaxID=216929 RepID=UPI003D678864